jgi:hypothetical protein
VGAILKSPCPSVHTFITDIWLWQGDLYRVSSFQVYRTSTSCLQCDLEFFMFAVMKTFVTVISVSTGRNDFIFYIWLWHGDLYRVWACLPFPGLPHIYFLFTLRLTNERVGVLLARHSVQHLVIFGHYYLYLFHDNL